MKVDLFAQKLSSSLPKIGIENKQQIRKNENVSMFQNKNESIFVTNQNKIPQKNKSNMQSNFVKNKFIDQKQTQKFSKNANFSINTYDAFIQNNSLQINDRSKNSNIKKSINQEQHSKKKYIIRAYESDIERVNTTKQEASQMNEKAEQDLIYQNAHIQNTVQGLFQKSPINTTEVIVNQYFNVNKGKELSRKHSSLDSTKLKKAKLNIQMKNGKFDYNELSTPQTLSQKKKHIANEMSSNSYRANHTQNQIQRNNKLTQNIQAKVSLFDINDAKNLQTDNNPYLIYDSKQIQENNRLIPRMETNRLNGNPNIENDLNNPNQKINEILTVKNKIKQIAQDIDQVLLSNDAQYIQEFLINYEKKKLSPLQNANNDYTLLSQKIQKLETLINQSIVNKNSKKLPLFELSRVKEYINPKKVGQFQNVYNESIVEKLQKRQVSLIRQRSNLKKQNNESSIINKKQSTLEKSRHQLKYLSVNKAQNHSQLNNERIMMIGAKGIRNGNFGLKNSSSDVVIVFPEIQKQIHDQMKKNSRFCLACSQNSKNKFQRSSQNKIDNDMIKYLHICGIEHIKNQIEDQIHVDNMKNQIEDMPQRQQIRKQRFDSINEYMADVLAQDDSMNRNQSAEVIQKDVQNVNFEEKSEFLKSQYRKLRKIEERDSQQKDENSPINIQIKFKNQMEQSLDERNNMTLNLKNIEETPPMPFKFQEKEIQIEEVQEQNIVSNSNEVLNLNEYFKNMNESLQSEVQKKMSSTNKDQHKFLEFTESQKKIVRFKKETSNLIDNSNEISQIQITKTPNPENGNLNEKLSKKQKKKSKQSGQNTEQLNEIQSIYDKFQNSQRIQAKTIEIVSHASSFRQWIQKNTQFNKTNQQKTSQNTERGLSNQLKKYEEYASKKSRMTDKLGAFKTIQGDLGLFLPVFLDNKKSNRLGSQAELKQSFRQIEKPVMVDISVGNTNQMKIDEKNIREFGCDPIVFQDQIIQIQDQSKIEFENLFDSQIEIIQEKSKIDINKESIVDMKRKSNIDIQEIINEDIQIVQDEPQIQFGEDSQIQIGNESQILENLGSQMIKVHDSQKSKFKKIRQSEDKKIKDWCNSSIYQSVQNQKNKTDKQDDQLIFNPTKLEIFTESEVNYNCSLLQKNNDKDEIQYDQEILSALFEKSKRTLQVLNSNLQIQKRNNLSMDFEEEQMQLIQKNEVDLNNSILILLRCKKLYQAYFEIKKILLLVVRQEEIFQNDNGIVFSILQKNEEVTDFELQTLLKSQQVLIKLCRRISQLLRDHPVFKETFIYKGKDHRQTMLQYSVKICLFLDYQNCEEDFRDPVLDHNGHLKFQRKPISQSQELEVFQKYVNEYEIHNQQNENYKENKLYKSVDNNIAKRQFEDEEEKILNTKTASNSVPQNAFQSKHLQNMIHSEQQNNWKKQTNKNLQIFQDSSVNLIIQNPSYENQEGFNDQQQNMMNLRKKKSFEKQGEIEKLSRKKYKLNKQSDLKIIYDEKSAEEEEYNTSFSDDGETILALCQQLIDSSSQSEVPQEILIDQNKFSKSKLTFQNNQVTSFNRILQNQYPIQVIKTNSEGTESTVQQNFDLQINQNVIIKDSKDFQKLIQNNKNLAKKMNDYDINFEKAKLNYKMQKQQLRAALNITPRLDPSIIVTPELRINEQFEKESQFLTKKDNNSQAGMTESMMTINQKIYQVSNKSFYSVNVNQEFAMGKNHWNEEEENKVQEKKVGGTNRGCETEHYFPQNINFNN